MSTRTRYTVSLEFGGELAEGHPPFTLVFTPSLSTGDRVVLSEWWNSLFSPGQASELPLLNHRV